MWAKKDTHGVRRYPRSRCHFGAARKYWIPAVTWRSRSFQKLKCCQLRIWCPEVVIQGIVLGRVGSVGIVWSWPKCPPLQKHTKTLTTMEPADQIKTHAHAVPMCWSMWASQGNCVRTCLKRFFRLLTVFALFTGYLAHSLDVHWPFLDGFTLKKKERDNFLLPGHLGWRNPETDGGMVNKCKQVDLDAQCCELSQAIYVAFTTIRKWTIWH